jgi:hypothetical protein
LAVDTTSSTTTGRQAEERFGFEISRPFEHKDEHIADIRGFLSDIDLATGYTRRLSCHRPMHDDHDGSQIRARPVMGWFVEA